MTGGICGQLLGHRGGRTGAFLLAAVVTVAVLGPLVTGDPDATDYGDQLASPSGAHWLGTDEAGRDVLARTVAGTRTSLGAAATVSLLTIGIGLAVGGTAGFLRGPLDTVASRLIDVLLGLPDLILALAIVGALGVGHGNLVLALALSGWAPLARLARSLALGGRARLDVISARLAGAGRVRAFGTHVVPGMVAQVLVVAATGFGTVVLALAGLSFLGLGAQPPTAELGRMLADSRGDLARSPWLAAGPGAVIVLTVAAAMLLSDALRDVLDPSEVSSRSPRTSGRVQVRPARNGVETRSPGPTPVLAAEGLTVTYPDGTEAVRNVDLDVQAGECLAVVGESGSGKTTVGRAVLRLLPDGTEVSGRLEVDGADVLTLTGSDLQHLRGRTVGYVAQDPFGACDPLRPVGGHVAEAWRAHRLDTPGDLADRVGDLGVERAGKRLKERPHQWSGGMLQRATIAAAAAHNPLLTLADEPTSALDADHADGVLTTLRRASRALLLISHDLGLVGAHADRIAVMRGGEVVEIGPAREVLKRPRHAYTKALLRASVRASVRAGEGRSSSGNGSGDVRGGDGLPAPLTSHRTPGVPDSDEPVVRAEGLVRRYGSGRRGSWGARRDPEATSVPAVDGISLTVRPGEIVGVSGPSGCGKSTLLRLLGGWERPDHGTVHYGDRAARPTRRHPAAYPRAGYVMPVFQDPFASVDARWPIWRIVTEPLTVRPEGVTRRDRRELAGSWLERVGLAHLSPDARPSELSGGQCQRVALARALAARPALLLADEPTARQDVITAAAMTRLLRAAVADGTALVVVSHDTAWLEQLADRTITLG